MCQDDSWRIPPTTLCFTHRKWGYPACVFDEEEK